MNYITTTDLRTKSSQLVKDLAKGNSVSLIHRSKILGIIKPVQKKSKTMTKANIQKLKKLAKQLDLPDLSYEEREKKYRKHLLEKYGKSIS